MDTLFYSLLHMFVDGLCAFSMFAFFKGGEHWYLNILLYNFCAFALQLLFGAVLDLLNKLQELDEQGRIGRLDLPALCAGAGLLITAVGAMTHPVILGIGNALFHVGGGVGTILSDREKHLKGQALGVFVAPGALGLYLGRYIGGVLSSQAAKGIVLICAGVFVALYAPLILRERKPVKKTEKMKQHERKLSEREKNEPALLVAAAVALAFIVVVLRSHAGMSISFTWNTGLAYGLACTFAVVLGKMAGGIIAARFGTELAVVTSLVLAAFAYGYSDVPFLGISALFFFNMTMPITLYMIVRRLRDYPGTSFGLLTLALFLGFLPAYFTLPLRFTGNVRGVIISLVSLALLMFAIFLLKWARHTARVTGENTVQNEEEK